MPRNARVAISLPEQRLGDIEETRRLHGESRSQFFCRAAEVLIGAQRQQELDEQYIAAYRAIPEVVDEGLYQAGLAAIAQEPWEENSRLEFDSAGKMASLENRPLTWTSSRWFRRGCWTGE